MRPVTSTPKALKKVVPGRSSSGTRKLRPSSPPVSHESCEASTAKADATASVIMAKKIVCTRSENSPITEREQRRERQRDDEPERDRVPARAERIERDRNAVAADAVEHRVRERDHAGVAEQQVVGRRERDEDADLGRDIERLRAGKQKRRERQRVTMTISATVSTLLRGGSPESGIIGWSPGKDRAAATAGSRPSARCR